MTATATCMVAVVVSALAFRHLYEGAIMLADIVTVALEGD